MTALVVAAHPDDETLGAGGTIARMVGQGREVAWLVLGEGTTSRAYDPEATATPQHEECRRAAGLLGVDDVTLGSLPDNRFDSVDLLDVARLVEQEVARVGPSVVLTHHAGDLNVDHRVTHEAVLVATRPGTGHGVHTVLAFEVLSSTEWSFSARSAFHPTVFVDVTETLEAKVRALEAYESELRQFPHPRSPEVVRALATVRGSTAGVAAAEAFELVRSVR